MPDCSLVALASVIWCPIAAGLRLPLLCGVICGRAVRPWGKLCQCPYVDILMSLLMGSAVGGSARPQLGCLCLLASGWAATEFGVDPAGFGVGPKPLTLAPRGAVHQEDWGCLGGILHFVVLAASIPVVAVICCGPADGHCCVGRAVQS